MDVPMIKVISVDGTDTMPSMAKKINDNFVQLSNICEGAYAYQHKTKIVAYSGQIYFDFGKSFLRNSNTLLVFLNGVIQIQNESYVEVSDTTIKFLEPLKDGDEVYMVGMAVRERVFVENGFISREYMDARIAQEVDKLREEIPNNAILMGSELFFRRIGIDGSVKELFSVEVGTTSFDSDGVLLAENAILDQDGVLIMMDHRVDNNGVLYKEG